MALESLHTIQTYDTPHTHPLVHFFLPSAGWEDGKTLFGAPYDWRQSPQGLSTTMSNLTALIEDAVSVNGGKKVNACLSVYLSLCMCAGAHARL